MWWSRSEVTGSLNFFLDISKQWWIWRQVQHIDYTLPLTMFKLHSHNSTTRVAAHFPKESNLLSAIPSANLVFTMKKMCVCFQTNWYMCFHACYFRLQKVFFVATDSILAFSFHLLPFWHFVPAKPYAGSGRISKLCDYQAYVQVKLAASSVQN